MSQVFGSLLIKGEKKVQVQGKEVDIFFFYKSEGEK